MAAAPSSQSRWLFGPLPDLFLGCGLLYMVTILVFAAAGPSIRALQPVYVVPLLILLVSMPHYGGTLVRVYEHRADRRSYVIFSVWARIQAAGDTASLPHASAVQTESKPRLSASRMRSMGILMSAGE